MKISLAVALLLNCVDASSLHTEEAESLDDLTYLMEDAQGDSPICNLNVRRLFGRSNSLDTFKKVNSASKYMKDPSFEAGKNSIAWPKKWGRDENDTMKGWNNGKYFKWLRPAQQLKKTGSDKKFSLWGPTGKPNPSGIEQGELTTCWYLSALAAVAEKPEIISQGLFQHTELSTNGWYRLRFWVKNQWVYVNVND